MSKRIPFQHPGPARRPLTGEAGQDRRDRSTSGTWQCHLHTLAPVCIRSLFDRLAPKKAHAFLPGSSIRGMVRNAAEISGNGCALLGCTEASACIACRIFGFVAGNFTWQSRVRFSDSDPIPVAWERYDTNDRPHGPPPGNGWLVFPTEPCTTWTGNVPFAPKGTTFPFTVDYWNLDPEEHALLRYALTLDDGSEQVCHMLGFAKSMGFGACTIDTDQDAALDPYCGGAAFQQFRELRRKSRLL
jgi:hypothetical protein